MASDKDPLNLGMFNDVKCGSQGFSTLQILKTIRHFSKKYLIDKEIGIYSVIDTRAT